MKTVTGEMTRRQIQRLPRQGECVGVEKRIAFVTDSTAGLTKEQIERHNITVVPLSVIFGDKAYREGVDLTTDEFYPMLSTSKSLPTTSQPPVGEFVEAFEHLLTNHDAVMCLLLSAHLSGTLQSATAAAEMVGGDIYVVDSGISSYGIEGPLLDGIELFHGGGTPEEIVELWQKELAGQRAFFLVDTLEQLHRGGRIGGAAAVFGALLQIKPILTIRDGKIDLYDKVRTHRRALERILSEFHADAEKDVPLQVGVVHSQRLDDALKLRDELAAQYPIHRFDVAELSPVVGTHTGAGLLALIYYPRALS